MLPHAPGFGAAPHAPHGKHGGKKGHHGKKAAASAAVAPAAAAAAATPMLDVMSTELEGPKEEIVRSYKSGELFGELALLYHCPRTATVRASSDAQLWSLERAVFQVSMPLSHLPPNATCTPSAQRHPSAPPHASPPPLAVLQNVVLEVNARRAIECEKFLAQVMIPPPTPHLPRREARRVVAAPTTCT